MHTVKGRGLGALATGPKAKAASPPWAAGVRRAVRGLDRRNIGGAGVGLWHLDRDGYAVTDGYAVRVWSETSAEGVAIAAMFAELGVEGCSAAVYVRGSGSPVAELLVSACPNIPAVLAPREEVTTDDVERVAAANGAEYPDGLIRVTAGDVVALCDARRVGPFSDAVSVGVVGSHLPVRFYAADGILLGVLMPLRGVEVAEGGAL
jgi:hypothetical protein